MAPTAHITPQKFRWLNWLMALAGKSVGVIGIGNVGEEAAAVCYRKGANVHVYDKHKDSFLSCYTHEPCLKSLVANCDIVIGTTGRDVFVNDIADMMFREGQQFYSFSSKDVEFKAILQALSQDVEHYVDQTGTLHGRINKIAIKVMKRGYPVNFGGTPTNMPTQLDQRYAAVYLSAIIQCSLLLATDISQPQKIASQRVLHSPALQAMAIEAALGGLIETGLYDADKLALARQESYYRQNSGDARTVGQLLGGNNPLSNLERLISQRQLASIGKKPCLEVLSL